MPFTNAIDTNEAQGQLSSEHEIGIKGITPRLPADQIKRRLILGAVISVVANVIIWTLVAQVVRTRIAAPMPPATFTRIVISAPLKSHKLDRKIKAQAKLQEPKQKPQLHQKVQKQQPTTVRRVAYTPKSGQILTEKRSTSDSSPVNQTSSIPVDGNSTAAPVNSNPAQGQPTLPPAPTVPAHPVTAPLPKALPAPQPPAPKGPTQDAQPENQVYPQIPDDLKSQDYKSFVRVKVVIATDGSFVATLVASSGSIDIDQRVLAALKQWKWKPALSDGLPIESMQRFRFNFEVQ